MIPNDGFNGVYQIKELQPESVLYHLCLKVAYIKELQAL